MSLIMDNRLDNVNSEDEVKKLQELVNELKLQNAELLSERQTLLSKTKEINSVEQNEKEKSENETKDKLIIYKENSCNSPSVLDSLPLDLSIIQNQFSSNEETWLYDSPAAISENGDWLRKDLDDPSLVVVKKTLINKLDEIANSPRHSPSHSLYSPSSSSGVLSPESPTSLKGEIDSRTFIRPRKKRSLPSELFSDANRYNVMEKAEPPNGVHRSRIGSREYLGRSTGSMGSEEEDRHSSASDASYSSFKLTDVEDVNAVARLQEESLKLSEPRVISRMSPGIRPPGMKAPSPIAGPCSTRTKTWSSEDSPLSSQEDLLTSPLGSQTCLQRPMVRTGLQPPRRYPTIIPSSYSEKSPLPDGHIYSQNNVEMHNGRSISSRLPSLTRRLGGSDSYIVDQCHSPHDSVTSSPLRTLNFRSGSTSDLGSESRPSRLHTPQSRPSRLSAPSPVRISHGSLQLMDLPTANVAGAYRPKIVSNNSAVPRQASISRLQPPRSRQLSQSPSKPSVPSDWREGCY